MYESTGTRKEWENYIKEKIKELEYAIANFSIEDDETYDELQDLKRELEFHKSRLSAEVKEVNDIKGYWNHSTVWNNDGTEYGYQCNLDFIESQSWEGQFILYEDGWFEGIVKDSGQSGKVYPKDRFIFGAYSPSKYIELLKCTPSDVSDSFVFHGTRDAKGYDGPFEIIGMFGTNLYGSTHIITQISENQHTEELEKRIAKWKKMMAEDINIHLYNNTLAMRTQWLEIIKRQILGQKFTTEEISEMSEVVDAVNERVVEKTNEHIKKLVLLPTFIIDDEDDNLPF